MSRQTEVKAVVRTTAAKSAKRLHVDAKNILTSYLCSNELSDVYILFAFLRGQRNPRETVF